MLALAGFRRLLAAPVRSGGAMPRKGKGAAKGPAETGAAAAGPVVAAGDGCVRVAVRAKPGSRCSAVTDVTAEAVGVAIAAPPSEGEANAELCRYLSKVLEVKKSEVILEKVLFQPEMLLQMVRKQNILTLPDFRGIAGSVGLFAERDTLPSWRWEAGISGTWHVILHQEGIPPHQLAGSPQRTASTDGSVFLHNS
ncbi:UPF0235 protein C15orf40 homolog isoform X1 [Strix aluco]|uniref:UPF0235 protein C15orf40 homolog isoform X1 n=1 Tax=Strix aluco TaxID=111821 RepID=UPI003DA32C41